eukprot:1552462-Prymnesium_polylepis.1
MRGHLAQALAPGDMRVWLTGMIDAASQRETCSLLCPPARARVPVSATDASSPFDHRRERSAHAPPCCCCLLGRRLRARCRGPSSVCRTWAPASERRIRPETVHPGPLWHRRRWTMTKIRRPPAAPEAAQQAGALRAQSGAWRRRQSPCRQVA